MFLWEICSLGREGDRPSFLPCVQYNTTRISSLFYSFPFPFLWIRIVFYFSFFWGQMTGWMVVVCRFGRKEGRKKREEVRVLLPCPALSCPAPRFPLHFFFIYLFYSFLFIYPLLILFFTLNLLVVLVLVFGQVKSSQVDLYIRVSGWQWECSCYLSIYLSSSVYLPYGYVYMYMYSWFEIE